MAEGQALEEWRRFPQLPGTHLWTQTAGWRVWELVGSNGAVWARSEGGYFLNPRSTITSRGQTFRWRTSGKKDSIRDLVDVSTSQFVLQVTGVHYGHSAGTRVQFHDNPLELPVMGLSPLTAVMSVTNRAGEDLMKFRLDWTQRRSQRQTLPPLKHFTKVPSALYYNPHRVIQGAVSAEACDIPQIEVLAAVVSDCVYSYTQINGGGS